MSMLKTLQATGSVLLLLASSSLALARQEVSKVTEASAAPVITAGASAERVRFSAPGAVVQMRLQVYSDTAQTMFDAASKGNVLDWTVQDGSGGRLRTGDYLCVVTIKSLNGKLGQKICEIAIHEQQTELRSVDLTRLTVTQQRELGPMEEDSAILILRDNEAEAATIVAHNGEEGQITRGRGALSFRMGDFFRGKDIEQMRLTPEGNLGIGISNPTVRLDVDGLIHSRQGIVFPDGSIQFSAARKTFGAGSLMPGQSQHAHGQDAGTLAVETSGTGTTGQIPRWLDGPNGVLTDSNITELNGAIGINGSPNSNFKLDVNGTTRLRGSNPAFNLVGLRPAGNQWVFQTVDDDGRFRLFGQDNVNPGVERLTISLSTGNVGIGTSAPISPLHVAAPAPILRLQDTDNPGAGQVGTVSFLNGSAVETGWIGFGASANANASFMNNRAGGNTSLGAGGLEILTVTPGGFVGIGTTAPQARLDVRGGIRLGSNGQYRATSGEEDLRIIRGVVNGECCEPAEVIAGSGFSATRINPGDYEITFNTCFNGIPAVVVTADQYLSARAATTQFVSPCGLRIHIEDDAYRIFAFIAIGPR